MPSILFLEPNKTPKIAEGMAPPSDRIRVQENPHVVTLLLSRKPGYAKLTYSNGRAVWVNPSAVRYVEEAA